MFASRLGSLSTVFTWLRSRACCEICSVPAVPLPPTPPEPKPLDPPPSPNLDLGLQSLEQPTKPQPSLLCNCHPAPTPPQPSPATKALGLPPCPPGKLRPPPPQGIRQKMTLEISKIRHKLPNLLSLGPVPLPPTPRNRSFCTPPPSPCTPPPHRASFKKREVLQFTTIIALRCALHRCSGQNICR